MPNDHVPATDTGSPATKTLRDCQHDAVMLAALVEGVGILDDEGSANARCALVGLTLEKANELSRNLDLLSLAERRATA